MKLAASLRRLSTLQIALALSVAAHAVLLSVRFVDPERFNRVFESDDFTDGQDGFAIPLL